MSTRTKLVGATIGAFLCGLVFASGLDLTRFGYAQSRTGASAQVATIPASAPPASVAALNGSFVDLAERLTPAVVSIEALRENRRAQGQRETPRGVPRGFEEFFEQFGDPRQRQQPNQASGSGFIVSRDGYILTNNHVVAEFDQVNVTLTDRRSFTAKVVGRDPTTDVAVLKIEGGNLPVAPLGNDANVRIGEWVLAIGNPLGLDFTVTAGIVSAKGRGSLDLPGISGADGYGITDMIQTDAAINPGNSGGPLVNIRGEVIGINAAIASNTGLYSGYGFAIPITLAKTVMDDILKHGRVRRAVLGVQIGEVNAATARRAKLPEISGVLVTNFPENVDSPARRAGIELGDVIVSADGKKADHVATLQRIIRNFEPGQTVSLEIVRNGERKTVQVRLAEAPSPTQQVAREAEATSPREGVIYDRLGITVEPITDTWAREYEVPNEHRGLRVKDVSVTGTGRGAFSQYDIIEAVLYPGPRKSIRTVDDLSEVIQRLRPGDVLSLLVYNVRARGTRVVDVELGGR
ncbi:MAG TPA: Do family serine endopeptidase [Gemmatimonadaceae bacterium]|nr:Do family serine endopeptidase [Gemmatimonadaceae bacterium]